MEDMIYSLLDGAVNDIFLKMQMELHIDSGDIEPFDAYELYKKEHELSMIIGRVLREQRGEMDNDD